MQKFKYIVFILLSICLSPALADTDVVRLQDEFIKKMESQYGFDSADLKKLFAEAIVSETILDAISRPAEKSLQWHEYRNIFLKEKRINEGVKFMVKNHATLKAAEQRFGIPPEIITAIIGVETFYGRIVGSYRVVDALHTLAFYYPKRAAFFRNELEQFLLLAREQGFDPMSLKGSYAGAMGMPQFISSSYRHYAIDFDADNIIDIWNNPDDAIGSVANYFAEHGWQKDKPVIVKVEVVGDQYKKVLGNGLKPDLNKSELASFGIKSNSVFEKNEKLKLLEYKQKTNNEYWLAHKNFYVITRYNHSYLYAMAVYQLALAIADRFNNTSHNLAQ